MQRLHQCTLASLLLFTSLGQSAYAEEHERKLTEVREAIERGARFLYKNQNPAGWWSSSEIPALTALALVALEMSEVSKLDAKYGSERRRALDFIAGSAKPDGSIHRGQLVNYNTACSLMALSLAGEPRFRPLIIKARTYIADSQIDLGEKDEMDDYHDGGVGYNSKYDHSDMNNTLMAIEAMRMSELALRRPDKPDQPLESDLDWKALEHFLSSCQNLPERSNNPSLSSSAEDRGGFIYHPGESKAGEVVDEQTRRLALRSYGSISYAGMMSFAYARIGRDDERVKAVIDWLGRNYTIEENPGMGSEGVYYYYHLMAKALKAQGVATLEGPEENKIEWRTELKTKLLSLQKPDGSWQNPTKRWMEGDPNLTTAYVLVALVLTESE
ncbi:MAG: terpene cyclase/mutase family protein [Verrucomicrobia bacterium]|nr:terpene cyclase/mutase family protein [Verrucomicrobiota bacterium]